MKKILAFAAMTLIVATIFAQEKKAVIGVAELTTSLSEATVEGYWGEYWGSPDAEDASSYTKQKTEINTKLKRNAEAPATLEQVRFTLQNIFFDYFADSGLFEEVVECNASGSDAGDIDYLIQPSLVMLYLNRGIFKEPGPSNTYIADSYSIIGVAVNFKDVKANKTYPPMVLYVGYNYEKGTAGNKRKETENGAYVYENTIVRNMDLINPDDQRTGEGYLGKMLDAAISKGKQKDDFLYEKSLSGLKLLARNAIVLVSHKINPPTVQAVDENGIVTFSALGFGGSLLQKAHSALGLGEKDMLDVMDGEKHVAEIYIYEIEDRIGYAKVDPLNPEFSNAEIKPGFYIRPAQREYTHKEANNAVKNIKKELKSVKKAQKDSAKAKK